MPRNLHHRSASETPYKEWRLCLANLPNQPRPTSQVVGDTIGSGLKASLEYLASVASGLYRGFKEAWEKDTRPEQIKAHEMIIAAEFIRMTPPSLHRLLEEGFKNREGLSFEQLMVLTRYDAWFTAFEHPDIFNTKKDKRPIKLLTLKDGPNGIIDSLDEKGRKRLFLEMTQRLIPPEVRDHDVVGPVHEQIFGPDGQSLEKQADTLAGNKARALRVLRGVVGIRTPGDPDTMTDAEKEEFAVARQSLMHHYWQNGEREFEGKKLPITHGPIPAEKPDGSPGFLSVGAKPGLVEDFGRMMPFMPSAKRVEDLQPALPDSLLKGALATGVIEKEDFPVLQEVLTQRNIDRAKARIDTRSEVIDLTGSLQREKAEEAKKVMDIFWDMSFTEKAILIGALVYAIRNIRGVGGFAVALTGLYFGQRLLLKQEDPINEVWSPIVQGVTKKTTGWMATGLKEYAGVRWPGDPLSSDELLKRADLMEQFLTEHAREELNSAVTGFTLLADMPLNELAMYLTPRQDGTGAVLRAWDSGFQKSIRSLLEKYGLKPSAASEFFEGGKEVYLNDEELERVVGKPTVNKNLLDCGDALSSIFYLVAAQNPANREKVHLIEDMRRSSYRGGYTTLPEDANIDGQIVYPRQMYLDLVRQGMMTAPGIPLGEFVKKRIGFVGLREPRESAEEIQYYFKIRKQEIELYDYKGKATGMGVEEKNRMVELGLRPTGNSSGPLLHPLRMTIADFSRRGRDELLAMWRKDVFDKRKDALKQASAIPGQPGGLTSFDLKMEGEDILYSHSPGVTIDVARSSAYDFWRFDDATIHQKYAQWKDPATRPAGVGDDAMLVPIP